jgi:putative flippase GtrA
MRKLKVKEKREVKRIVEYLVSGGAYFWSGYAMFFVLDQLVGLNLWWAKLLANVTGWVVNYVLQRYWVFKNPQLSKHQSQVTGRYAVITLVDWLIDYFIVAGLKSVGITPYIGQFVSSGFFTVWNYLWYKYWVFPEKFTKQKSKVTVPRVVAHRAQSHHAYRKP